MSVEWTETYDKLYFLIFICLPEVFRKKRFICTNKTAFLTQKYWKINYHFRTDSR